MIRAISGLTLLLWACLPAGVVAAVWTGDWRWAATGVAAFLLGCFAGLGLVEAAKRAKR